MPSYAYKAVHESGRVTRGESTAVNENELAHYLGEAGLELIDAREKKQRVFSLSFTGAAPPRALAVFCARLHDLIASGIPFLDALRDVTATTDNALLRNVLTDVGHAIATGGGIAMSFALYPRWFPPVFTAIVGAGENSGDIGRVFAYLARYAETRAFTQEKMRRALRYPLFLFVVAGSAVGFMLVAVVPQLAQFLNGIQSHLPLSTRILVTLSAGFSAYGGWIAGGVVAALCGLVAARLLFPGFAVALDAALLRLPVIGAVIAKTSLARFAHSFALLFQSGCEAPDCLRQARGAIGNRALNAAMAQAEQRVLAGSSLSQALGGIFPSFAVGLLRTGERSGNLVKSLDDIAAAYDREAQAAVDGLIGMLEPGLTLAIGSLMIWTVLAVLGPLYGSLSVLGGRM